MTRATNLYRQWEIWQVNWPHDDGTSKERPSLIFSPNELNRSGVPIYFIKISTKDRPEAKSKIQVLKNDPVFEGCGLPEDSYIYPQKVRRLSGDDILWVKGSLPEAVQEIVTEEIMRVTGFPFT